MAFWVEFRCDWRETWNRESSCDDGCWSHHNAGPGEISGNTATDVSSARAFLVESFKNGGFLKVGANWACPVCADKIKAGLLPRDPDEV